MAMGEPIGESLLRTQNATEADYYPGPQLVHTSLMGDPSLRLHPVKPVENLTATENLLGVEINWTAPAGEAMAGYNIYRATDPLGDLVKINPNLITGTSFFDNLQPTDSALYMVRAVKLESSGSGTYWNMSLGKTAWSSGDPCYGLNVETELNVEICEGQTYEFNGATYSQAGIYEHHFPAANGCDSLVMFYLQVESLPTVSISTIICEGESLPVGDIVLTESGLYELEVYNDMGCVQHWTVSLTVAPVTDTMIDVEYVPPIVVDGTTHFDEFSVIYALTSSQGCDSLVTINYFPLVSSTQLEKEEAIRIFPNPTSGQFFIENKIDKEALGLEILNAIGQTVFSQNLVASEINAININHLPNAVYWLKIKTLQGSIIKRLVLLNQP
jgi:hypothetical protein